MTFGRKPAPPDTRTPMQRLMDDLAPYSATSTPGRARVMLDALQAEAQMRGIPSGIGAVSLTAAAGILSRAARGHNDHDAAGLIRIAQWLERLSRG